MDETWDTQKIPKWRNSESTHTRAHTHTTITTHHHTTPHRITPHHTTKREKMVGKNSWETLICGLKQENRETSAINWKLLWSPWLQPPVNLWNYLETYLKSYQTSIIPNVWCSPLLFCFHIFFWTANSRKFDSFRLLRTVSNVSVFGVFLVHIFPHLDWIRRFALEIPVFSPNAGEYGPENLRIRTLFMQWSWYLCFIWTLLLAAKSSCGIVSLISLFQHYARINKYYILYVKVIFVSDLICIYRSRRHSKWLWRWHSQYNEGSWIFNLTIKPNGNCG